MINPKELDSVPIIVNNKSLKFACDIIELHPDTNTKKTIKKKPMIKRIAMVDLIISLSSLFVLAPAPILLPPLSFGC